MDTSRKNAQKTNDRLWSLDLLRILATYGIVLLHTSPLPASCTDVLSLPWQIATSISSLFCWSVPAFFMISGTLFLSPQRCFSIGRLYRRTIPRVTVSFLFWSAFYAVVHCVIMGKGKWTFLNQLLRGHYHMWFIFAILGLYMLTPFLRRMTESKQLTEYFLILGFLFVFLLPRMLAFILLFTPPHADVIASAQSAVTQLNPLSGATALYYFVLGHYLYAYPIKQTPRRLLVAAGALGVFMTVALTLWHSALLGKSSSQFLGMSSMTVLFMTVGMFLLLRYACARFRPGQRLGRVLQTLSACSFGVYLVHPFIIERLQLTLPPSPIILLLGVPGLALFISLISLSVSYLLHQIPVLNRFIV
ncbi:MAG: acyltransferase [Candidatus Ventricola sp.]